MNKKNWLKFGFGVAIFTSLALASAFSNAAPKKVAPVKATPVKTAPVKTISENIPKQVAPQGYDLLNPENVIVMDTTKGQIIIALEPRIAPNHVERFKQLTRQKFYDGIIFHRVIDGFMVQGGDPTGVGTGSSELPDLKGEFIFKRGSEFPILKAQEINGIISGWYGLIPIYTQVDALMARTKDGKVWANGLHCPGIASMARASDPNSANSQFFLMREYTKSLDNKYSIWGKAVSGLDVIRSIKVVASSGGKPPLGADKMIKVSVLADLPEKTRPKVYVEKANRPEFLLRLQEEITKKGTAFSVCDFGPDVKIIN